MWVFITALFVVSPNWKQPSRWVKKLIYPYSAVVFRDTGNELLCHKRTWRKLKCILLSKRSQSEKVTYYMIPSM